MKIIISLNDDALTIPLSYSPSYYEDEKQYLSQFRDDYNWGHVLPAPTEERYTFSTVAVPEDVYATYMVNKENVSLHYQTAADIAIASLSDEAAWSICSDGIFNDYPATSYSRIKDQLSAIKNNYTRTVNVRCWYWEDAEDETNMNKVTVSKTFAVNDAIADMFTHIFEDIYAHPSQPIINIADGGMGTWVLRGKNHNSSNTLSAHSLGTAIDINPGTGSFFINGVWYGNAYNQKSMPTSLWIQLPESHKKYHVLYDDSPIVKIFKAYGWYWGGDWTTTKDPMHLAFLGDGSTARQSAHNNLLRGG